MRASTGGAARVNLRPDKIPSAGEAIQFLDRSPGVGPIRTAIAVGVADRSPYGVVVSPRSEVRRSFDCGANARAHVSGVQ